MALRIREWREQVVQAFREFDDVKFQFKLFVIELGKEPDHIRAAYGEATDFLLARRLVEAEVSVVTLPCRFPAKIGDFAHGSIDHWDTHWHNFKYLRLMLPKYDQAVSALITDLYQRGLDNDVAVLIWGEFGRTPLVDYSLLPGTLA